MPTPEAVLRTYFHAKDENRPHLLSSVFSPAARLEVHNNAATIAFPAVTTGQDAIAEVLVRRFAQTYENVYSFYMAQPPPVATTFSCDWLVCMSEKEDKNTKVGCGRYDWTFQTESPHLASHLVITIEVMQVLPPRMLPPVVGWLRHLDYPWSSATAVRSNAPSIELLAPVLQYLGRDDRA